MICRHPCIVNFLGACLSDNIFMVRLIGRVLMPRMGCSVAADPGCLSAQVTELMQCDLYDALGHRSLQARLAWRRQGVRIALDIARGLSCELPSSLLRWAGKASFAAAEVQCWLQIFMTQ